MEKYLNYLLVSLRWLFLLQVVQWAAFYCWRNKMEDKYKEIAIETKYGNYKIEYSDKKWGSIASQLSNGMSWIGAGEYLFKADDIVLIKKIGK